MIQNLHTKPSESPKYIIKNQQSFYHLTSKDMKLNFSTEQELIFIIGCLRWEKLWNHITIILLLLFKENITSIKVKSRFVTKDTISYHREDNPIYNLIHFFFYHVCFCFNFLKQGSCRSIKNWRLYRKKNWAADIARQIVGRQWDKNDISSIYRWLYEMVDSFEDLRVHLSLPLLLYN